MSRRTKELGIRVALGARRTHVMSAAVGRPIVLLGVGSVVGLLSGVFATRLLGQIVYQANPRDPVVLGGAVLTMALLGIAASAIPAWREMCIRDRCGDNCRSRDSAGQSSIYSKRGFNCKRTAAS